MPGIIKEVWAADIANNLFPDDSFLNRSIDDTPFVDENGVVHLPQAGGKPNVEINRSGTPSVRNRVDADATYTLDKFSTDPDVIKRLDELEVSYSKRMSVLDDHIGSLNEKMAGKIAYEWASETAGQIVRTTGANRTAFVPGATGNRKKIQLEDIAAAKRILDNQDIPQSGRVMVLPAEMYNDLLEIDKVIEHQKHGVVTLPSGVVNRLYGFDIYIRSSVVSYSNAALPVKRAVGATALTTANAAALCFHERFVRKALGQVHVFETLEQAQYYGDLFSAEAKAGGRKRYAEGLGVVSIIEAAGV